MAEAQPARTSQPSSTAATEPRIIEGVLLSVDYLTVGDRAWVRLWLSGEDEAVAVLDPSFEPYFYAVPEPGIGAEATARHLEQIGAGDTTPDRCEVVQRSQGLDILDVVRVVARHPQDVPALREKVRRHEDVASTREDDVLFANRYLIDSDLRPITWTRVTAQPSQRRKGALELISAEQDPEREIDLHLLAFDLEVYNPRVTPDAGRDPILIASIADNRGHEETLVKGDDEDDARIIQELAARIEDRDPDVLVTYNGDNFDWPYLVARAEEHGIDLPVGRDGSPPTIRQAGRDKAVRVTGRGNVDGYQMAQRDLPDVKVKKLERVAEHLGVVDQADRANIDATNMAELWDDASKREEVIAYALDDATSALGIAEELLGLQIGLARRTYQDLSDGSRMGRGRQADWYLLAEAFRRGIISPDKRRGQMAGGQYEGGTVLEPPAGIHTDVVYLDFSSMYPSIMVAHNVSPDTFVPPGEEVDGEVHEAPEVGHRFRAEPDGFFKRLLAELIGARREIKDELADLPDDSDQRRRLKVEEQAIKVLTNAFYGYMGWSGARWQSIPCAEATTAWGRHFIQQVADKARERGMEVLYGDSLTEERLVTVRDPGGLVKPIPIGELFETTRHQGGGTTRHGKEHVPGAGFEALSVDPETQETRWAPINRVIRHRCEKRVFRVWQKHGETRVTEDHSLMTLGEGDLAATRPEDVALRELYRVQDVERGTLVEEVDLLEALGGYEVHLHAKGKDRVARVYDHGDRIAFGWQERSAQITLPRTVEVGSPAFEALCRLVGAYVAEGSASTPETTSSRMGASIASADVAWLDQLQEDYQTLFQGAKASVIRSTPGTRRLEQDDGTILEYEDQTHKLEMMNQLSAVFFRELCGQTSQGKRLPDFVFNVPEGYQRLVLDTMVQGDGSRWPDPRYEPAYHEENFTYTTKSLGLISGLSLLLNQLGYTYSIQYRQDKQAYTLKTSSSHNSSLETRLREEPYEGHVYDLDVEGTSTFVDACGHVLLHNTDSTMVLDHPEIDAFVDQINQELPIELEVEDRFDVLFFTGAKKRYAGRTQDGRTVVRGLEVRRGDWCDYAKDVQQRVIDALLTKQDPEEATQIGIQAIEDLREGRVPLEDLTIYKTLTMPPEKYKSKQPHALAVERAREQEPDYKPPVGSKIGYVIVEADSELISQRARLVEFVDEDEHLDSEYYIESQVVPAALRVLEYFGVTENELRGRPTQSSLGEWV